MWFGLGKLCCFNTAEKNSLTKIDSRIIGLRCQIYIFSSPEHKVLMVSYCDRVLSVVRRRPSSVVRRPSCVNFFT